MLEEELGEEVTYLPLGESQFEAVVLVLELRLGVNLSLIGGATPRLPFVFGALPGGLESCGHQKTARQ